MQVIWRTAVVVACDAVTAVAGAWILWNSSTDSVVTGSFEAQLLFVGLIAVLLTFRGTILPDSLPWHVRYQAARSVVLLDTAAAAGLGLVWQVTQFYFFGWLTTLASLFLLIGAILQLLIDVTTGRNDASKSDSPRAPRLLSSIELARVGSAIAAVGVLIWTISVHEWSPGLINPLILWISIGTGISAFILWGGRRARAMRALRQVA